MPEETQMPNLIQVLEVGGIPLVEEEFEFPIVQQPAADENMAAMLAKAGDGVIELMPQPLAVLLAEVEEGGLIQEAVQREAEYEKILEDLGADFNVPIGVILEAIKNNIKKEKPACRTNLIRMKGPQRWFSG
ncbi:hypothetical protein AMTR_s00021p00225370 [Amborella trichopoda]|uniref:Uncharacterized protein n=1 Tax=Amborella trichopoda TaxID=13333 RepID=W1Q029_AMBTC|nr:hypothetical protein AMTR_s00021p00225370 [Amborella trichopoda]